MAVISQWASFKCAGHLHRAFTQSSRRPLTAKDIYKDINYCAPFSDQDRQLIMKMLNEGLDTDLVHLMPKAKVPHLLRHREQAGPFQNVEQLLDVQGMNIALLERICGKILRKRIADKDACKPRVRTNLAFQLRQFNPRIQSDIISSRDSVVGIKCNLTSLSFTQLCTLPGDEGRCDLTEWGSIALSRSVSSGKKLNFDITKAYNVCHELAPKLPKAPVYLIEDTSPITKKDPFLDMKMHQQVLLAVLFSRLMAVPGVRQVFISSYSVISEHFHVRQSCKGATSTDKVKELLQHPSAELQIIRPNLVSVFNGSSQKEQLASSLLLAMAFFRVCRLAADPSALDKTCVDQQ